MSKRRLLTMCLCLTSTTLALGDEGTKPDLVPRPRVVDSPDLPPAISAPDVAPGSEEAATAQTTEWQPRLMVSIRTVDALSVPTKVRVPEQDSFEKPPEISRFVPEESPSADVAAPQGSATYREVEVRTLRVSPGWLFSLYCDAVTMNISHEGESPSYHLECKSRVHVSTDGFSVDADSATFKDGKCELVNATLKSGVVTATAQQLELIIPVRGLSTSTYRRPVPKVPLGVNMTDPPSTRGNFFGPDGGIPTPKSSTFSED
jgi:hypothetical protein